MTIIPLLDQAVNLQSASGSSRGAVRIVAASGAARLQVSIHVANCCLATEKAPTTMAVLRERLSALYDSAAETSVTPLGGHAAQATLAIPLDVPNQRSGRATQPA